MNTFTESNRYKHFIVGFAIGFICIIFAVLAGLYKEYHDRNHGGLFDRMDLLYTILGGILGQMISVLIFLIVY